MRTLKLFLLSFILVACSSSAPKRNFAVALYETDAVCIRKVSQDGQVIIVCDDSPEWPSDLVGITIKDYNLERGYQDLLINRCKKWRK